jgi:hypothetical protein
MTLSSIVDFALIGIALSIAGFLFVALLLEIVQCGGRRRR